MSLRLVKNVAKDFSTCSAIVSSLRFKNKVTVFVPVAIKVPEPSSVMAIISKAFKIISLACEYKPELLKIELGIFLAAFPPFLSIFLVG